MAAEEVAKIWVNAVVLGERRQRNEGCGGGAAAGAGMLGTGRGGGGGSGRGGLSIGVYRSELSLGLKHSSDSAVTTAWGCPFQSGMVLWKNDICLYILCPAGWDAVAAGVVLSGAQSAACHRSDQCLAFTRKLEWVKER